MNVAAKEYDGENKYIRITDIDDNTHKFLSDSLTSPDIDLTGAENYKLAKGDILFARTGASVGKSYIYRDYDGLVYYAGFLIRARIRDEYDAEFVFQNTLTDKYNKYIAVTSQRSGQPGVNAQEYSEFKIQVPKKEEQIKIGKYFQNLDHLITLHQRKLYHFVKRESFAWEQRKLSEIADKVTEKNKNNDFSEPFTNSAEQGIISQKDYFDREIVNNENLTGYYIVRNNDFIYNPRISVSAPVGPINRNRLSRNGVMSPLYTVFRTHDIDHLYLEFYFKTTRWHRFMKLNGDSGARFDRFTISSTEFMKMPIPYPGIEEQKKIGKYFDNLDHLITLHQRKCDETKKIKKYMLQKMFPQNGKKVPELRFLGFTDDWEQRKLGDVFQEYSEKNYTELPTLTIIQGGGTVKREDSDRNLMYNESNLSNYKMVRKDDFIVHLRSFEGGLEKSSLDGIISPAYHTFHSDVADSRFYYPYFRSHEFIKHKLVPHVYGIRDGRSIDISGMKTIEIPYTSMEEQRTIGDYLEALDNLITLHQRKYEELQKVKKFMLQNMFV